MRTSDEQRKYDLEHPIYKTDLTKPTSACIGALRSKIAEARGQLGDIMRGKGWEDRLIHVEGLLTCGLVALHNSMTEIYEHELKTLDHELGPSVSFSSRGVGLDMVPCCFVCGKTVRHEGANGYLHNIAALIDKKGEAAVLALFSMGARMDYYHGDENSPQIKIGACDKHKNNLQTLHDRTYYYRRIRPADVNASINA